MYPSDKKEMMSWWRGRACCPPPPLPPLPKYKRQKISCGTIVESDLPFVSYFQFFPNVCHFVCVRVWPTPHTSELGCITNFDTFFIM